jgi:hypothetical protein
MNIHTNKIHQTNLEHSPTVAVGLAALLRIRQVQGSNLGPETDYHDTFFVIFLSLSRQALT